MQRKLAWRTETLNSNVPFTNITLKIGEGKSVKSLLDEIKTLPAGACEILLEIPKEILGAATTVNLGKRAINTHIYQQLMAWSE